MEVSYIHEKLCQQITDSALLNTDFACDEFYFGDVITGLVHPKSFEFGVVNNSSQFVDYHSTFNNECKITVSKDSKFYSVGSLIFIQVQCAHFSKRTFRKKIHLQLWSGEGS